MLYFIAGFNWTKMTKDPEDPLKYKGQSKKRHGSSSNSSSKNMEGFLKNQNEIVAKLKADLQDAIAEKQQIKCEIIERNKCIQELQNK